MIKHIVMWRLKETAHGNTKEENAKLIKEKLEVLPKTIAELWQLEVGIDFSKSENSGDVVLCTAFAAKEDLIAYQAHPDHRAVVPFIIEACSERRVVDYEE